MATEGHGRRKLFDLAQLARASLAAEAVRRIDAIFDAERAINGMPAEQRLAVRQTQVAPLVADLEIWMRGVRATMSRHADVAKAMDYMLKRWSPFSRFLEDGRICLTNKRAVSPSPSTLPPGPSTASSSAAVVSSSSSCSSNWSSSLRPRSDEAPNRSCRSLAIISFKYATMASAPDARASASRRASCSAKRAARSAVMSSGMGGAAVVTSPIQPHRAAAGYSFQAISGIYPAISGRHVRCGFLQSMPSSSIDRVAGVSKTTPSLACGQMNRPRSSRLA